MNSKISHNTLPEFRNLVERFKQTGSLGVDKQPIKEVEDDLAAHFAKESYTEFTKAAEEMDWMQGQAKPTESLDSDPRAGHYRADVAEGTLPESGYAEFHADNSAPAEVMRFFETADGQAGASSLVGIDKTLEGGNLDVLTGTMEGNSLKLVAFHFAPDGSATREVIERTAKGIFPL